MSVKRENWGSKFGFILAAAGSAIGLGNIWKFPYIAGENGGAAFIFIYLICIAIIGFPVLIAEILIGRTGQKDPVGSFKKLSNSKFWTAAGAMGVAAGFIILSYYGVISGWSFGYIVEAAMDNFGTFAHADHSNTHFGELIGNPYWTIGFHALFMVTVVLIVFAGVQKGIERGSKILMPLLLVILIILMIRGLTLDGAEKGVEFLLNPDWSKVNGDTVLTALGHAFFTLSLGMGAMMTYGSYMSKKDSIFNSALEIIILDTAIALIAGIAIFTSVFAIGQNPSEGPGLIFQTLPVVFAKMPGGYFFGILFFLLLTIAALTSAISLLEVVVSYFVDEKNWPRHKAAVAFGIIIFIIGLPSAMSFNLMGDFKMFRLSVFDFADYITSNLMLPLGGLLIALFVGWAWGFDKVMENVKEGAESLYNKAPWVFSFWKFFLKYLSPVLIFLVLLHSIGLF